ncbi:MAG: tRNA (adenosine(37)-N6)-dimethylallyltransferase MiaA [Gammaproteobacteria bacterium]|nr:tRNA (adenosine(37)-N6)-dimethylallyltransferase MiaA [Gammaproteobacteria bacterium]
MNSYKSLPPAILLMGPTAAGKTALALELVRRFPCDIISVDSAMVYRGMDIGTAKPDAATLRSAPHRLIDILDPAESYSAGRFRQDALAAMAEITAAGRVPLLVGGTMLYFRALQQGLAQLPTAEAHLRAELDARAARLGWPALHAELARVDPAAAARIHVHDPQRIQRALEVFYLTGRPVSELHAAAEVQDSMYRYVRLAVAPASRAQLHEHIVSRFQAMMAAGFLAEVAGLRKRGDLSRVHTSMRAVGYRQLWEHLDGECDLPTAVQRGIVATRRYAKRQFTWLRAETGVQWFESDAPAGAAAVCAAVAGALQGRA